MIKRIALFLVLNLAILLTISCLCNLLHIGPYLTRYGLDLRSLFAFCLLWGTAGAFISLLLSKQMAKWFLNVRIVNLNNPEERMVFEMVARLSQKAGLPAIPDVGIFPSHEANAFATGPSKRRSLVAVSEGLLRQLSKEEVEGVIGHEIAHIANGDMVTMTLLQGVVNAFVMFLARVCAYLLSRDRNGRTNHTSFSLFTFLFELCFMAFGMLVITYFSRLREFRADRGSAKLLGKEPMINALRKLQRLSAKEEVEMGSVAALMIASQKKSWSQLLATHPPLEERIARLESI